MQKETKELLPRGHITIFHTVIAASIMRLDKLTQLVTDEKSVVLGFNTDSVKVLYPKKKIEDNIQRYGPNELGIGGFKIEMINKRY